MSSIDKLVVITATVILTQALTASGQQAEAPLSLQALQSLVAGVAMYPDAVIEQVLTAAQEPIALHQGAQQLSNTAASEANQALQSSLPPSVRYLQQYPQLLKQLDAELPQTIRLGVAAKNQTQDVWNAIDAVRAQSTQQTNAVADSTESVEASSTATSSLGIYGVPVGVVGPAWLAPLVVNEAREAHLRNTVIDAATPFGRNGTAGAARLGRPLDGAPAANFQRGLPAAQHPGLNNPGTRGPQPRAGNGVRPSPSGRGRGRR